MNHKTPFIVAELGGRRRSVHMLHLFAALAEKERRLISQRTKDALAAKKAQGVRLGGLNAGVIRSRDEARARAERRCVLFWRSLSAMSARAVAVELNTHKVPTAVTDHEIGRLLTKALGKQDVAPSLRDTIKLFLLFHPECQWQK